MRRHLRLRGIKDGAGGGVRNLALFVTSEPLPPPELHRHEIFMERPTGLEPVCMRWQRIVLAAVRRTLIGQTFMERSTEFESVLEGWKPSVLAVEH